MAELIDKGLLFETLKQEKQKFTGEMYNASICMVEDKIRRLPTTTEAEIIEKFAEKLGEAFSEKSSEIKVDGMTFDILTLDSVIEIMWDLVEQVKGE